MLWWESVKIIIRVPQINVQFFASYKHTVHIMDTAKPLDSYLEHVTVKSHHVV